MPAKGNPGRSIAEPGEEVILMSVLKCVFDRLRVGVLEFRTGGKTATKL